MKIITFDIEDWFHILDNPETDHINAWSQFESRIDSGVDRILETLSKHNLRATFFILGWIAEKHPQIVQKIDAAGHHIGSHSFAHQLAYTQTKQTFTDDLLKSKHLLEALIGKPVNTYRAPGFSITEENLWAFEHLVESGFEIDSSIFPAGRAHGGLPGFGRSQPAIAIINAKPLKLFPINSRELMGKSFIYSGGGYFRLFPEFLLRKWFKDDQYIMTYFHPRDFDAAQPILPGLSKLRKFKSYVGISTSLSKLDTILGENQFVALDEAAQQIDWNTAHQFDL